MFRTLSIVAGLAMLVPSMLMAQTGDADAGEGKAVTCAACHGPKGVSISPEFPNLAGQVHGFIAAQLKMFKKGDRENAIMAGMSQPLSEQDMADLDAYYASLPANKGSITPEQEELALAGQSLYKAGSAEYSTPACMSCHSPTGSGIAPTFPRLAGQPASYIKSSLLAYKAGTRKNEMMNHIAFPLSEAQIEALATYISGLN